MGVLVVENILGNEKMLVLALDKNIFKKIIIVLDSKKNAITHLWLNVNKYENTTEMGDLNAKIGEIGSSNKNGELLNDLLETTSLMINTE